MGDVDVIIVNYRTKELTDSAARSVLEEPELNHVIIVDNASGDGSAEYLQSRLKEARVKLFALDRNRGFGGGNNFAAAEATADYLFFLNSDAAIKPGCLSRLTRRLEAPMIGLVAPAIYLEDGTTLQADAMGVFPSPARLLTRTTRAVPNRDEPDWITGAAFMARREEFLALDGFAEELFMYYEDVDLCRRYRQSGKRIVVAWEAGVVHLGGRSKLSTSRQKLAYFKSQDLYLKRAGYSTLSRLFVRIVRSPHLLLGRLFLWK